MEKEEEQVVLSVLEVEVEFKKEEEEEQVILRREVEFKEEEQVIWWALEVEVEFKEEEEEEQVIWWCWRSRWSSRRKRRRNR